MSRFVGGPADGQRLMLRRAPLFLRVTEEGGKFDALDQLDDQPKPSEKLYAYVRQGEATVVHLKADKFSGWFRIADYLFVDPQPIDTTLRWEVNWRAWCQSQQKQLKAKA